MRAARRGGAALVAAALGVGLAACSGPGGPTGTPVPLPETSSPSAESPPAESPSPSPAGPTGPVQPAGEPTDLATGLDAPWSAVPVEGSVLISQRDLGNVVEVLADGSIREVGPVQGVAPGGEGGLLGLALLEDDGERWLYAYYTAEDDNRIVRMPLTGGPGSFALGPQSVVLEGLLTAANHNGGRIAFGPDGMLYATVGDAGQRETAQDPASPNGKILRMRPDGAVPPGNPFPGSLVWSMGHRNPQGIAWAADGTMFAAEFGQNTWDELNRIEPGGDYGWPAVEGQAGDGRFLDPVVQWSTSDASPSGLAMAGDTLFLAALRGQAVWMVQGALTGNAVATDFFTGQYGRIRHVLLAPDGSLWFLTNNTDGRGAPRDGDDRLVRIALAPA